MNTWKEQQSNFDSDGSLRDIYVFNADVNLWNKFLDCVRRSPYMVEFFHADELREVPNNISEVRSLILRSNKTFYMG
jgi:hypothetical protein